MSQVALRQTVEEAECKNPRATKAIKDNLYMHILDLVTKNEEATELMMAIDGILKTRGFQVKDGSQAENWTMKKMRVSQLGIIKMTYTSTK